MKNLVDCDHVTIVKKIEEINILKRGPLEKQLIKKKN